MYVIGGFRLLELPEIPNRAILFAAKFILADEVSGLQFRKHLAHVDIVGREQPHFEHERLPFENTLVVGLDAKAYDADARDHADGDDAFVSEKAGMNRTDASHYSASLNVMMKLTPPSAARARRWNDLD
ncbi:hypothetical protein ATM17_12780 [Sphingopyxis macrogoltabida]|uniref:Uncharacterized protein n=1 Tax=Sphingopyxis macrogoltabida TaxID=33050 RepID=A0AAC9FFM5_SPHMC|nr:hypothetical protein ATM17_12780 [Sphingopyxis macrogoltabida]